MHTVHVDLRIMRSPTHNLYVKAAFNVEGFPAVTVIKYDPDEVDLREIKRECEVILDYAGAKDSKWQFSVCVSDSEWSKESVALKCRLNSQLTKWKPLST